MNDYKMTFTGEHDDQPQTCIVTERSENAARKFFTSGPKGLGLTLTGVELVKENTCATKDQEREAVENIRAIIADLGPQSYVATALEGSMEIAECNIENDFGDSWKSRAACAERDKNEAENKLRQEIEEHQQTRHYAETLNNSLESTRKDLEAARHRMIPSWLYLSIYSQITDQLTDTRERMRELADTMAECADHPETAKFRNAVQAYQVRRKDAEKLEKIIAGLEDIEPPAVAAGVTEAGE